MSQIATALGKSDDAKSYASLRDEVKRAFRGKFAPGGKINAQTQTAYVLALHFDLLEEQDRPAAVDALVADIESRGRHLSTGFVGTPYLNHVLTRFGRADLAFALLEQKTYPSWLYPITQGATTMWERWNAYTHEHGFGDAAMNSYNHYAYGAVGDWMYGTVAGIDLMPGTTAFKHIKIRPHVGGTLTHAKATLESPYGTIESGWCREGDRTRFRITIPANTTATISLPDGSTREVGSGKYEFVI
jgi:alpha-L-rhamnosidase